MFFFPSVSCFVIWVLGLVLGEVYPKVRVKVQTGEEEDDRYAYGKRSLQSLKAFEWLSLRNFSSSDESPRSVVRVPRAYVPQSPPPTFHASKDESHKKKAVAEENKKTVRANSAPRPRAVLSSPDNDGIIGSKTQARREVLSSLKSRNPCQNRHVTQCKMFPKSAAVESFAPVQGYKKEPAEPRNDVRAKGRKIMTTESSVRAGHRKKITPSSAQS